MLKLICVGLCVAVAVTAAWGGKPKETGRIDAIPQSYHLQAYDDCGVTDRQPHVQAQGVHTFAAADVNADEKTRSVAWHPQQILVTYTDLDAQLDYILAITYANEAFNNRTQSLRAGEIELHGPRALPKGKSERLIFRVPTAAIEGGKLILQFKLEGQVNVVVSAVELWSPSPSPKILHLASISGLYSDLTGRVLNLAYNNLPGVAVQLSVVGEAKLLATTQAGADGSFRFDRRVFENTARTKPLQLAATHDGATITEPVPASSLFFDPVRYRPVAAEVGGLKTAQVMLDGVWRINPSASDDVRKAPLATSGWGDFKVPGQWVQQGYDLPQDRLVAVAREFDVPAEWKGYRVILRFDAIHAGTRYWINGKELGYCENLFTPVEWDITDALRAGERNRLDLEMKVDTVSERLSYASGYAFHNLGGIDRSVRLFALPPVHVRSMRVTTDLDAAYRDADLRLDLNLENSGSDSVRGLSLEVLLTGPDGKSVNHSVPKTDLAALPPGATSRTITSRVADPLKWNAEHPNLYRVFLEVKQDGKLLERIERDIGFRKIEIRERQLCVNGVRVKLAGACHHETDPLTGRADTMHHAEQDVRLLKSANLNYLRTSHYPPNQELLDAADRLGMYVEAEAPFCWVNESWDLTHCREVLTPTSAMIDYCHAHPSVMFWSLANESSFRPFFEVSNKLCKDLDPTRPTTFNNPDPKRICDIANVHYPPMPYGDSTKGDPRPVLLGEYFYPVCHEQTDVRINPGLRELWGAGHSDPDSDWGKACAASYPPGAALVPGGRPGAWSYLNRSATLIGGAIWAAIDEPYYLPDGKKVGYAWVHGFWGVIDGWRRPKPEHWLAKLVFSPVWFPVRQVELVPGKDTITIPVENRYSFTNLNELTITWEFAGQTGTLKVDVPPASTGQIDIPAPRDSKPGDGITLRACDAKGEVVNTMVLHLGKHPPETLPQPSAGAAKWQDDGKIILIEGDQFALVLDKTTGDLIPADPRHNAPLIRFPSLHVTRYDYGDLGPSGSLPYAVLPNEKSRVVESVSAVERDGALEVTVRDRYDDFGGAMTLQIDRKGVGRVSRDYAYFGPDISVRESGVKLLLRLECDEIRWRRWSEWDIYPDDHISRTEGVAKARRDTARWGPDVPESVKPSWPWSLDQTELGTNDFRAIKFNIYEASLRAPDGTGIGVRADADVHVRPCLSSDGMKLHLLSRCRLGPIPLKRGDVVSDAYVIELLRP